MPVVMPAAGSKQVASVHADIGANTSGFEKGAASVKGGLAGMVTQFLGTAAAIAVFQQAIEFSINAAAEAERVDAQLGAVLTSTGGAAGMARDELEELATSLSRVSTYDDEAIKSSEALLLTFTKVGSDVFPEATQAILDMSTALGTDLQSATLQVGKALNDPIKGITALSRAGVSFTKEQKDLIKSLVESGRTMEAQKIILDELSKEFGGSATAAAETYEGQIKQLKNEVGNLGEAFGSKLIPVLTDVAGGFTDYLRILEDANKLMESGENGYKRAAIYQATIEEVNRRNAEATKEATGAISDQVDVLSSEYIPTIEELEKAEKDLQKANASIIDGAIGITNANKTHAESQQAVLDKIAETRAEGEKLYPWEHEKILENQAALEDLGDQYFENQEKFRAAQEERAAMMAIEAIAMSDGIAGYSDAERERARVILETTDIATAAAFEEQQAIMAMSQAVADGTLPVENWGSVFNTVMADGKSSVEEVQAAIDAVPKENTVNFTITTTGAPPNLDVSAEASNAPRGTHRSSHATGGSFMIPASYGNEGFMMGGGDTASGKELIRITPAGQDPNAAVVEAIYATRITADDIARAVVTASQQVSK